MPVPLPLADASADAHARWSAFLRRRQELVGRMHLSVCDGCDGCGSRCADGFTVTRDEWDAARAYHAALPDAERARIDAQPRDVPWPGAEDLGVTYRRCRFRDVARGRCAIYPVRPTVCRLFGHTEWLPCPIGAVPSVPDDAPALWRDYRGFERRSWDGWEALETTAATGPNDDSTGEIGGVSADDSLA